MRNPFKSISDWYKKSHRYLHARLGSYLFFFMLALCIALRVSHSCSVIISDATVLLIMIAVEVTQKRSGGQPDVNDVVAGMTTPALYTVAAVLFGIIFTFLR